MPLAEAGLDGFHCSTRRYWEPEFECSDMNLAGWTKKITGKVSIPLDSVGLSEDFIGVGRQLDLGQAQPIYTLEAISLQRFRHKDLFF